MRLLFHSNYNMNIQNHYLDLFNTKTNSNDMILFYTEIAIMHNALGQVLKQFMMMINQNKTKRNTPLIVANPESKSHSDISFTGS